MGYVDLHAHVLPDLDDGPRSLESSLRLLRAAWESGTTHIVTTPHLFHDSFPHVTTSLICSTFERLQADLARKGELEEWAFLNKMQLSLGAEHFLSAELRLALKQRTVLTLNGSRYLLIEGPPTLSRLNWKESMSRVTSAGYWPVIAHPERYWPFQRDPSHLAELIEDGCLVQVNAADLARGGDGPSRRTARKLLRRGLVHLIASDAHHAEHRPPELAAAAAALPGGSGGAAARVLLKHNPSEIAANADPPAPLSSSATGLWARLRSRLS